MAIQRESAANLKTKAITDTSLIQVLVMNFPKPLSYAYHQIRMLVVPLIYFAFPKTFSIGISSYCPIKLEIF